MLLDRENLQKEVTSLKSEINRISDSTNFNGINLLDGSVNKTSAVTAGTITATKNEAVQSKALGTFGTEENGEKKAATAPVDYSAKFYIGDITNNNAGAKDIVINYKDNAGASASVTLSVASGTTVGADDVKNALNGTAVAGITVTDSAAANAFDGSGKTGQFTDLFDVTSDGNIITITAKADKSFSDPDEVINGVNLDDSLSVTTNFDGGDQTAATETLKEKYDGTTEGAIAFGHSAGEKTLYVPEEAASYKVASKVLTLDSAITDGKAAHNSAITVGDHTSSIR